MPLLNEDELKRRFPNCDIEVERLPMEHAWELTFTKAVRIQLADNLIENKQEWESTLQKVANALNE